MKYRPQLRIGSERQNKNLHWDKRRVYISKPPKENANCFDPYCQVIMVSSSSIRNPVFVEERNKFFWCENFEYLTSEAMV